MGHKLTFTVTNYPNSRFARRITFDCTCGKHGKHGKVEDGRTAPTMARARKAAQRHTAVAA